MMTTSFRALKSVRRSHLAIFMAVLAGVIAAAVLVFGHGGGAGAAHASLSRVQRSIQVALARSANERSAAARGRDRRVAFVIRRAPRRGFRIAVSGSVRLARGYPHLEPNAHAIVQLEFKPISHQPYGHVCWKVAGIESREPITAGGIYEAPAGLEGGLIIALAHPSARWSENGCTMVYSLVLDQIARDPSGYYIQLATAGHPAGAIRGQL